MRDLLRDFRAEGELEAGILVRIQRFIADHEDGALGSEIAYEIGHITASAWIVDPQESAVLLVFGRKEGAWKLPGAHCDGNLIETAKNEAMRALGHAPRAEEPILWALAEREIPAYWNTPAHRHFEMIFRFVESTQDELPRGARWFALADAALLGDATLARLATKDAQERRFC